MTIAEYKAKLNRMRNDPDVAGNFVRTVTQTITEQADRIFTDGLDAKGAPIGRYSAKPMYVNTTDASPRKIQGKGKTGKTRFKNGKPLKSTYFAGGYREFKMKVGRGKKFNLFLFGNFNRAYLAGAVRPVVVEQPGKTIVFFGINAGSDNPQGKIDGLFKRYPQAFRFSIHEKVNHRARVQALLNKALK